MQKISLNKNWYFCKIEEESKQIPVNLPHDAMMMEQRIPNMENGSASGFFPGGKYCYSRMIFGEECICDKQIILEFEGIYMDSSIFLNGEKVGGWIYGYTDFYVDITGKLLKDKDNELVVIADNSRTPNSRWYSGSGIYRPVSMYVGENQYICPEGIRVTTKSILPAVVEININAVLKTDSEVITEINYNGMKVAEGKGLQFTTEIPDAYLWSSDTPNLYQAKSYIMKDGQVLDTETVTFGIRSIAWSAVSGLQINNKTIKLKGGCVHHDNGPLGAAANRKAEFRKLTKMKELGYNAVRFSHYPADKYFLECCDQLGLYLIDETFDQWKIPQTKYDYALYFDQEWEKDIESLIAKDYNHPSVIMYCIGNEITDTGLSHGGAICRSICKKVKELDDSRPTTIAINSMLSVLADMQAKRAASEGDKLKDKKVGSQEVNDIITLLPKVMASITAESLEELIHEVVSAVDIVGYNYSENLFDKIHELYPERVILASETFPSKIGINWPKIQNEDYLIGDFMWTACDYLGEAGVGMPVYGQEQAPFNKSFPCLTAGCGSIDLTGFVESQGIYTSVVFGKEDRPHIAVRPMNHSDELYTLGKWRFTDAVNSWTWPGQEGKTAQIEIYSNADTVELFQDGTSLGKKKPEKCVAFYETTYRIGTLEVNCFNSDGEKTGSNEISSAGEISKLTLTAEDSVIQADGADLAYISIQITDENGIVKMLSDCRISVKVEGAGELAALGSGNPETTDNFQDDAYTTFQGRLLAIIRSKEIPGKIRVSASAEGYGDQSIEIIAI